MTAYIRNPLTYVWIFLTLITLAAWWLARGGGAAFQINPAITLSVLLIALIKSRLVMRYFMEVRYAPSWLRWTCDAWLVSLFALLITFYWLSL